MRSDPLFKGATRPAMLFGVPLVILVPVGMLFLSATVYVNWKAILFAVPAFLFLKWIARNDDQVFRLLMLRAVLRWSYAFRNLKFWGASVYSPVAFTSGKARGPLKLKKSER